MNRIKLDGKKIREHCRSAGIESRKELALKLQRNGVSTSYRVLEEWDRNGWPVLNSHGEKVIEALLDVLFCNKNMCFSCAAIKGKHLGWCVDILKKDERN